MHKRVPHIKNFPVQNATNTSIKKHYVNIITGYSIAQERNLKVIQDPFSSLLPSPSCHWVLLIIPPKHLSSQCPSLHPLCPILASKVFLLGCKLLLHRRFHSVFVEWMNFNHFYCFIFLSQSKYSKARLISLLLLLNLHFLLAIFRVKMKHRSLASPSSLIFYHSAMITCVAAFLNCHW